MAILNPEHLLEQAAKLIQPTSPGKPRQVDLRRGVSAAYYALFHEIINSIADEIVGAVHRGSKEYALVARQPDHGKIKDICIEIVKTDPPARYLPYIPATGFGTDILAVANAFPDLQKRRHEADYSPLAFFRASDVQADIDNSRTAIESLRTANTTPRKAFCYLILFPPRR